MYLDYDRLVEMIELLEKKNLAGAEETGRSVALTVPQQTNAAGMPIEKAVADMTQEQFYSFLEQEMRKIEQFTKKMVRDVRDTLHAVENEVNGRKPSDADKLRLQSKVDTAADDFLKLEKFVNINFLGFHKILKKHDRHLPNPCKSFYISRLHDQNWVRGDYSDVIVMMSRVYGAIRGDATVQEKESAAQNFCRSTSKYWVHTENISKVKYILLQHLPVFLQKSMDGESDSQLTNSVYLDNHAMELYHGRLDKSPGAIALRLRWYGTGTPEIVFVERKTHRESWAGEVSVKERFIIPESKVPSLLDGTFDIEGEMKKMRAKGKKEEDINEWLTLVKEITQAIDSKQLQPCVRTQCMRTAFQIPFDATVRVSLDTNLNMINERTEEALRGERWFRDPHVPLLPEDITRFPHAVLEIKLEIVEGNVAPQWVTDLIHSGLCMQVHKFSKFIHGCASLMPEDVQAVPYWIDDVTIADSLKHNQGAQLLKGGNVGKGYDHLIPHDKDGKVKPKIQPKQSKPMLENAKTTGQQWVPQAGSQQIELHEIHGSLCDSCYEPPDDCYCASWYGAASIGDVNTQKVEPKLNFANERTFMSWLGMAVSLSAISMGVLAYASGNSDGRAEVFALMMLPVSLLFIVYAVTTFLWRSVKIRVREAERWDDPYGPVLLTLVLIIALTVQFIVKFYDAIKAGKSAPLV